jgi:4a-hydroxytetrahydrobiopterin dehydratase
MDARTSTTPPASLDELGALACVACEGIGSSFDEATAAAWHELLPDWTRDGTASIERTFRTKTFRAAFDLAALVADEADAQGHHPDLEIGWGRLTVRLTTHALGGLTENDFVLAARVDRLAAG